MANALNLIGVSAPEKMQEDLKMDSMDRYYNMSMVDVAYELMTKKRKQQLIFINCGMKFVK